MERERLEITDGIGIRYAGRMRRTPCVQNIIEDFECKLCIAFQWSYSKSNSKLNYSLFDDRVLHNVSLDFLKAIFEVPQISDLTAYRTTLGGLNS